MTTLNAFGFLFLGAVMIFLPAIDPILFQVTALDGASTSALWLIVMGCFQGSLGLAFIVRNEAAPLAVRLMNLRFPAIRPVIRSAPAQVLRPLPRGLTHGRSGEAQRMAA